MKKKSLHFFIYFLVISCYLLFPKAVEAHVLQLDGNIGAVLHMDPEDDPVAQKPTGFFFEFKDKENKFLPQNCDCTFNIIADEKEIFSQPLFQDNSNPTLTNASVLYTFPQKNIYTVEVIGKPVTPGAFQEFHLVYHVRVEKIANSAVTSQDTDLFETYRFPLSILAVVFLFVFFSQQKRLVTKGKEEHHK